MRVLVACEFSGTVRNAFAARGHDAWSNDLLPAEGQHLQMDCFDAIHDYGPWNLIILHPPCTALAVSGNRWYGKGMPKHRERLKAIRWTRALWKVAMFESEYACLENPVGVLGAPDQYIQPWQFGHGETKKTGLWLHRLPPLEPTNIVEGREQRIWKMGPSPDRAQKRSISYSGVAEAMAAQWPSQEQESGDG